MLHEANSKLRRMDLTPGVSTDFWLAALRREGAAFRLAVGEPDLSAPVPCCPDWTVKDLVVHVGRIYEWIAAVAVAGGSKLSRPQTQPDDDAVLPWFDQSFGALVTALESVDPEAPAWNWSTQPKVAGFWPRRMAHETAVHRWDAELVSGRAQPVEADLAADGVSEVLDTWLPGGRGAATDTATGLVRLTATDLDRSWLVRLRPAGVTLLDEGTVFDDPTEAHTGVGGTASDLLLALWGRLTPSALIIDGDPVRFTALRVG